MLLIILFNEDPFYNKVGDMVRTGGISYKIDPKAKIERESQILF